MVELTWLLGTLHVSTQSLLTSCVKYHTQFNNLIYCRLETQYISTHIYKQTPPRFSIVLPLSVY